MMTFGYFFYKAIGAFLTPPGVFVLLLLLLSFRLSKRDEDRRRRIIVRAGPLLLALALYVLSTPLFARILAFPLEEPFEFVLPTPEGGSIVMVPAGGLWSIGGEVRMGAETLQRFTAGVDAAEHLGCPLLFSGGHPGIATERQVADAVKKAANRLGFRGELVVEGASRTTWENMKLSAPLVSRSGAKNLIIVTTAYHLKRSMSFARRFLPGMRIIPHPSGRLSESGGVSAMEFLPSASSLYVSTIMIREALGNIVYSILPDTTRRIMSPGC